MCEFMCGSVCACSREPFVSFLFHLQANSRERNYQIFGPEPQVIQFGCGIQLLVSSHTFQDCFPKNSTPKIKVLTFGSIA